MHEQFVREMPEKVNMNNMWQWLSRSDLKIWPFNAKYSIQIQLQLTNYN